MQRPYYIDFTTPSKVLGMQDHESMLVQDILPGMIVIKGIVEDVQEKTFSIKVATSIFGNVMAFTLYNVEALTSADSLTSIFESGGVKKGQSVELRGEVTTSYKMKGFCAVINIAGIDMTCVFSVEKLLDPNDAEMDIKDFPRISPDIRNMFYGPHWRHTIDIYYPKNPSQRLVPFIFKVHGGGWMAGSKLNVGWEASRAASQGIAFIAIHYRFISMSKEWFPEDPPVAAPLNDAVRALQFVRYHANELGLDKNNVGITGGSAGAATSLYLALHKDMADPFSEDPVLRESTRVNYCAPVQAQTSLDPVKMKEWCGPLMKYGGHIFFRNTGFDEACERRDEIADWLREYSPYELASKDAPPIYLDYNDRKSGEAEDSSHATHHPIFGIKLKEKLDRMGRECYLKAADISEPNYDDGLDFLIQRLLANMKQR